jgi:hypothetical protein
MVKEMTNGTAINKSYWDFLINNTTPKKITETEFYGFWLLEGCSEITESYDVLKDIATMVYRLRERKASVRRMRLLSYHIHNYYGESYILEKRLIAYPTQIFRKSKRWNKSSELQATTIAEMVRNAFKPINAARGAHIHGKRFTDRELTRLSLLERGAEEAPESLRKPLSDLFRVEFGICRRRWLENIQENNKRMQNFLEAYFDKIYELVFDTPGALR